MTPFRHLHRTFSDAVDVATFRGAKVRPVDDHSGPWTVAAALCFIGTVVSGHHDWPQMGLPAAIAFGAVTLAVVVYWSRMSEEALQRSYVGAALCGIFGVLYATAPNLPLRIALIVWLVAAWLAYLYSRGEFGSR